MSNAEEMHQLFEWMDANTEHWMMARNPHLAFNQAPSEFVLAQGPVESGDVFALDAADALYQVIAWTSETDMYETYSDRLKQALVSARKEMLLDA